MNCCKHCVDAEDFFDLKTARADLKRYNRKGPEKSTKHLIQSIPDHDIKNVTLLDIGGGIGAIPFELFGKGLAAATHADASTAYQKICSEEAQKRKLSNKITFIHGDAVELKDQLPVCDLVTLDRVLCCYPDVKKLIDASISRSKRIYGVVYPRNRFYFKLGIVVINLWFKIKKSEFRTYMHDESFVDDIIKSHGFILLSHKTTFLWQSVVYRRTE
jgi:magnesium-protoporphyrin O-methyltransferase